VSNIEKKIPPLIYEGLDEDLVQKCIYCLSPNPGNWNPIDETGCQCETLMKELALVDELRDKIVLGLRNLYFYFLPFELVGIQNRANQTFMEIIKESTFTLCEQKERSEREISIKVDFGVKHVKQARKLFDTTVVKSVIYAKFNPHLGERQLDIDTATFEMLETVEALLEKMDELKGILNRFMIHKYSAYMMEAEL
jgi:hypothetical protein